MDPQPGAPQHNDQAAHPPTVPPVTGLAHDGDDLIDRRWVGRLARPLLAGARPA